jgi:hypothetical protein
MLAGELAIGCVREPRRCDQRLDHRSSTAAVLPALRGFTVIIMALFEEASSQVTWAQSGEGNATPAGQTSIEPQPHCGKRHGPAGQLVSLARATAGHSRAEPVPHPKIPATLRLPETIEPSCRQCAYPPGGSPAIMDAQMCSSGCHVAAGGSVSCRFGRPARLSHQVKRPTLADATTGSVKSSTYSAAHAEDPDVGFRQSQRAFPARI